MGDPVRIRLLLKFSNDIRGAFPYLLFALRAKDPFTNTHTHTHTHTDAHLNASSASLSTFPGEADLVGVYFTQQNVGLSVSLWESTLLVKAHALRTWYSQLFRSCSDTHDVYFTLIYF